MAELRSDFREEIITIALGVTVVVAGTFFMFSKVLPQSKSNDNLVWVDEATLKKLESQSETDVLKTGGQVKSAIDENGENETTPRPTSRATPEGNTEIDTRVEIPYGTSEKFDNEYFILSFSNPRVVMGNSKVFTVEVVLANKSVEGGLANRIHATVKKDGTVLIEAAAMSSSEVKLVYPGQKLTFTASISLIEQTEVSTVIYDPGTDLPRVTYGVGAL